MKYTEKFALVSKWLTSFPEQKTKLMKLKSEHQMIAVNEVFNFVRNNLKSGIKHFDSEDFTDIIDTASKGIIVRKNDDKQYFK